MTEPIYKTFAVTSKAVDIDAGVFEAMISTEDVDRDHDVMIAAGAKIANYLKNPIVLFGHNYREADAVVGKALDIELVAGVGVKATWQFAGKEVSEEADLVRRLWTGGFLNATSIGFIPLKWEARETDDGEKLQRGRKYTEWELLEFSVVPVPANQSALRLAVKSVIDYLEDDQNTQTGITGKGEEPETSLPNQTTDDNTEPNNDDTKHNASDELTPEEWELLGQYFKMYKEVMK